MFRGRQVYPPPPRAIQSPADRGGRYRRPVACAAIVGLAAVLVLSVHRYTVPARGHAPAIAACHNSVAWTVTLPGAVADTAPANHPALRATFWVGLLSLASGVAVVQLASLLRTVRIGSRCGH